MTENKERRASVTESAPQYNKARAIVAFGLAALAVGGVGAAITSAAWTDNTWFAAPAAAATFDLQGSLDGTTWTQSDDENSIQLVVPASEFADLLPGETRSVDLWVRNQGSVDAALTSTVAMSPTSTFVDAPRSVLTGLATSLTPASETGSSDRFTLTLTTPSDWAPENQGATGTVIVTINATATATS